jgi:hypothetical protein
VRLRVRNRENGSSKFKVHKQDIRSVLLVLWIRDWRLGSGV